MKVLRRGLAHVLLCLIVLIGAVVSAARTRSDPRFAEGDCPGCWQGITPGRSTIEDTFSDLPARLEGAGGAAGIAPDDPPGALRWESIDLVALSFWGLSVEKGPIYRLCLRGGLTLGDVLADYGPPDGVRFGMSPAGETSATLRYERHRALIELSIPASGPLSPGQVIAQMCFWPELPASSPLLIDWEGFAPLVHYYPQTTPEATP
ncbi:MAG TPA: hypothetical protein VMT34_10580 [Aggregatilineales bacterium]|nr:hypothetical protein [Aggregatilineales bacterium]